jgi:hypothetical protein
LVRALDPLGNSVDPQSARQLDDRFHDRGILRPARDPVDERLIDLEDVYGESTKVYER